MNAPLNFRQAPHNIEAEQALLGAILLNNDALDRVAGFLKHHHFFEPLHRRIFETAQKQIQAGKLATPITLKTYFEHDDPVGELTAPQYLARLAAHATTVINAEDYGRTIHDLSLRRDLIQIGEDMVNIAYDSPVDAEPEEQIKEAEQRLYKLTTSRSQKRFVNFGDALRTVVHNTENAYERRGEGEIVLPGLKIGFNALDEFMGGLRRQTMTILAGGTGMGKTTFALQSVFNVASTGTPVSFLAREMPPEQLTLKVLSAYTGIPADIIERGKLSAAQLEQIIRAEAELSELPIIFDSAPHIDDFLPGTRRLIRERGVGLACVDYLGLLEASGRSLYEKNTHISKTLKRNFMDLDISGLVLAQLSREYKKSETGRPDIDHLRDSGAIEQDADSILFVFREEKILESREPKLGTPEHDKWQDRLREVRGMVEMILAKHRHGKTGTIHMRFQGETSTFLEC